MTSPDSTTLRERIERIERIEYLVRNSGTVHAPTEQALEEIGTIAVDLLSTAGEPVEMVRKRPQGFPAFYATFYPILIEIGLKHGYAMALHGSLARDMDVIAVPWTEEALSPEELVGTIEECFQLQHEAWKQTFEPKPEDGKPHGRRVWTICLEGGAFIDLSVMPKAIGESTPTGERPPLGWSKELTRTLIDLQDSRMGLTEALQVVQGEYLRLKAIGEPQPAEPVSYEGRMIIDGIPVGLSGSHEGWFKFPSREAFERVSARDDHETRKLYTTPQPPDPPEDDGREEKVEYVGSLKEGVYEASSDAAPSPVAQGGETVTNALRHFEQALSQWRMYADQDRWHGSTDDTDEFIANATDPEAVMYGEAVAAKDALAALKDTGEGKRLECRPLGMGLKGGTEWITLAVPFGSLPSVLPVKCDLIILSYPEPIPTEGET